MFLLISYHRIEITPEWWVKHGKDPVWKQKSSWESQREREREREREKERERGGESIFEILRGIYSRHHP